MKITRRQVIVGTLGIAAGAGLYSGFRGLYHISFADAVKEHLSYLTIDPEGLRRFEEDVTKNTPSGPALELMHVLANGPRRLERIQFLTESVSAHFLLSSDFFLNGSDTNRTVKYVTLFLPHAPCRNPFARFDL